MTLDGFHALKHAVRFGAEVEAVVCAHREAVLRLAAALAPDLVPWLEAHLEPVGPGALTRLLPRPHPTGVVAVARRPAATAGALHRALERAPAVLLDRPRALGNVGAVVRVAAAAGAAGVLVTGEADPWHRAAVRGAAGLGWALPFVGTVEDLPEGVELVAVDPEGEPLGPEAIREGTVLAFGSERHGLSRRIRERAARCVSIPMTPGVSSLNLATAVAVVLYQWRLGRSPGR